MHLWETNKEFDDMNSRVLNIINHAGYVPYANRCIEKTGRC